MCRINNNTTPNAPRVYTPTPGVPSGFADGSVRTITPAGGETLSPSF